MRVRHAASAVSDFPQHPGSLMHWRSRGCPEFSRVCGCRREHFTMKPSAGWMYALGILFGCASFLVTRGRDGNLFLFFVLFGLLGVGYCVFLLVLVDRRFTWQLVGHFWVYWLCAIVGGSIDSQLEGMAGALGVFIPLSILGTVLLGAIALFLRGGSSRKTGTCPQCGYSLVGLVSDRCPECGCTLPEKVGTAMTQ
jgi:hypothetical protein